MVNRDRLTAATATLALVFSLFACGNNASSPTPSSTSSENSFDFDAVLNPTESEPDAIILLSQRMVEVSENERKAEFTILNNTDDIVWDPSIRILLLDEDGETQQTDTAFPSNGKVEPGEERVLETTYRADRCAEFHYYIIQVESCNYVLNRNDDNKKYMVCTFADASPMEIGFSNTAGESEKPRKDEAHQGKTGQSNAVAPSINHYEKVTDEDLQSMLLANSEAIVKDHLKVPSSAKFPWGFSEYKFIDKGESDNHAGYHTYYIEGPVEAENGYGALLKSTFAVELDYYLGSENYYEVSCTIN